MKLKDKIQQLIKSIKTTFYSYIGKHLTKMDYMKSIDVHKKERKDSYQIFWIKATNLNYLAPVLIFSTLAIVFAWGTIKLTEEEIKIGAWLTALLSGISVSFLTSSLMKVINRDKLETKGLTAVRNLDTILINLIKIKDRKRVDDVDYIEEQIINSIEDWEDILPDLKYRDRVNQAREYNRKIEKLENSNTDKNNEISILKGELESLMTQSRSENLNSIPNYSGGTASNY